MAVSQHVIKYNYQPVTPALKMGEYKSRKRERVTLSYSTIRCGDDGAKESMMYNRVI